MDANCCHLIIDVPCLAIADVRSDRPAQRRPSGCLKLLFLFDQIMAFSLLWLRALISCLAYWRTKYRTDRSEEIKRIHFQASRKDQYVQVQSVCKLQYSRQIEILYPRNFAHDWDKGFSGPSFSTNDLSDKLLQTLPQRAISHSPFLFRHHGWAESRRKLNWTSKRNHASLQGGRKNGNPRISQFAF